MKFQSRKDVLMPLIVFGFTGLLLCMGWDFLVTSNSETENFFSLFLVFIVTILLWWIYFGTNYELNENEFHYKSGPLHGTIKIDQIREIIKNKTRWGGIKPALATKGLVVKYNKYDEIYISPKTNDSFIEKLLQLNPKIEIIEIEKRLGK